MKVMTTFRCQWRSWYYYTSRTMFLYIIQHKISVLYLIWLLTNSILIINIQWARLKLILSFALKTKHIEPFLLAALKVSRFRLLLIADLCEVSTRPHLWVLVWVCVYMRVHACVWSFITSCYVQYRQPLVDHTVVKREHFIGDMLSRDILLAIYFDKTRKDDGAPYVWYAVVLWWYSHRHTHGRALNIKAQHTIGNVSRVFTNSLRESKMDKALIEEGANSVQHLVESGVDQKLAFDIRFWGWPWPRSLRSTHILSDLC